VPGLAAASVAAALLRVIPGPREDSFSPDALATLTGAAWRVQPASNRVGIRLDGPRLERVDAGEPLSEGLVTGSVQVPPSGRPILLLPDHPTTGGYPVLAVVCEADLPVAGQLAPATTVRFAFA
jgi:allophanate hydrolase subunit 2